MTQSLPNPKRGEVWLLHSACKDTPENVLVIQNNVLSEHLDSLLVVPLISSHEVQPGVSVIHLSPIFTGLTQPIAALCHHTCHIPRESFVSRLGDVSPEAIGLVVRGILLTIEGQSSEETGPWN